MFVLMSSSNLLRPAMVKIESSVSWSTIVVAETASQVYGTQEPGAVRRASRLSRIKPTFKREHTHVFEDSDSTDSCRHAVVHPYASSCRWLLGRHGAWAMREQQSLQSRPQWEHSSCTLLWGLYSGSLLLEESSDRVLARQLRTGYVRAFRKAASSAHMIHCDLEPETLRTTQLESLQDRRIAPCTRCFQVQGIGVNLKHDYRHISRRAAPNTRRRA